MILGHQSWRPKHELTGHMEELSNPYRGLQKRWYGESSGVHPISEHLRKHTPCTHMVVARSWPSRWPRFCGTFSRTPHGVLRLSPYRRKNLINHSGKMVLQLGAAKRVFDKQWSSHHRSNDHATNAFIYVVTTIYASSKMQVLNLHNLASR